MAFVISGFRRPDPVFWPFSANRSDSLLRNLTAPCLALLLDYWPIIPFSAHGVMGQIQCLVRVWIGIDSADHRRNVNDHRALA